MKTSLYSTVVVNDRLICMNGQDPLWYVDLTTKKVKTYHPPLKGKHIPVRYYEEIKADTIIENVGGKVYLVTVL